MRALVFDKSLHFVPDYPDPPRRAGEALIRITRAGICNTDLEIVKGYMGFTGVLGHEFVGVVEEARDQRWIGKRVVGEINCSCGACDECRRGMPRHCPTRTVLGITGRSGVFADLVSLPVGNLHEVPKDLPDDEAVFTEPTAAAFEILEQLPELGPPYEVALLGDGKLGLIAAQVLATKGCRLLVIGKHAEKLSILKGLGIQTALVDERSGRQYECVVDCTGSLSGFDLANRLVRPRGVIVLKSTMAGMSPMNLAPVVINEVTVVGSRCGPFAPAIEALRARKVDVRPLVAATFPIEDGVAAIDCAAEKGTLKVLLRL